MTSDGDITPRYETDFKLYRVGHNTFDCDSDEIPGIGITLERYQEVGGVPLQRGKRMAEAESIQKIQRSVEAKLAAKALALVKSDLHLTQDDLLP